VSAHVLVGLDSVKADIKDFMLLSMHLSLLVVTDAEAATDLDTHASSIGLTCFIQLSLIVSVSVSGIFPPCYEASIGILISVNWRPREGRLSHPLESCLEWSHVETVLFQFTFQVLEEYFVLRLSFEVNLRRSLDGQLD